MNIIDPAASAQRTLAGDLSPAMRRALEAEIGLLTAGEHDLTESTTIIIVEAGDAAADIEREAGSALLVDPAGTRFDQPDFACPWDILTRHDGVFRMVITYGSTFATILLVPDADTILAELCHFHAA